MLKDENRIEFFIAATEKPQAALSLHRNIMRPNEASFEELEPQKYKLAISTNCVSTDFYPGMSSFNITLTTTTCQSQPITVFKSCGDLSNEKLLTLLRTC